jgi:hypothetical protein
MVIQNKFKKNKIALVKNLCKDLLFNNMFHIIPIFIPCHRTMVSSTFRCRIIIIFLILKIDSISKARRLQNILKDSHISFKNFWVKFGGEGVGAGNFNISKHNIISVQVATVLWYIRKQTWSLLPLLLITFLM